MSQLRRDDVDRFFDHSIHPPTRTIFMGTECNEHMAEAFLKGMHLISASEGDITIIMNNLGGDEYHGLAIYDSISTCTQPVTIKVYGQAMSMGSWIFQAADYRFMAPNSTLMLHWGSPLDHHAENERMNTLMVDTYLSRIHEKKPKFTREQLARLLAVETYLTPTQAIEYGLADSILE